MTWDQGRSHRSFVILSVSMLALLIASCGGGSPTSPGASAEFASGSVSIAADDFAVVALALDSRSALRVEINWTLTDNDLDAYLLRGSCTRDDITSAKATCTMGANVIAAGTGTSRPETAATPALDAGSYTLLILNRGDTADSGTYRVIRPGPADRTAGGDGSDNRHHFGGLRAAARSRPVVTRTSAGIRSLSTV